ncbi:hypothetical protein WMO41_12790 [Ventrimonas sp. CLA-AP-H27]|uniref:Uncharacterized protein n=1 Tax=Ventrimonas faecis TaxID=3133170 RepID=A0ABV1HPK2_9FIRM
MDAPAAIEEIEAFLNIEERANHDVSIAFSSREELKGLPDTDIITAGIPGRISKKAFIELKKTDWPKRLVCFFYPKSHAHLEQIPIN